MGKVASLFYTPQEGKVVFLRSFRKRYIYEGSAHAKLPVKDLWGREICISYFYPDLIVEKVEVPPVEDEETLSALLTKRLSETGGIQSDLLLCAVEVLEESTSESMTYRVFAIPRDVYENGELFPVEQREKVRIFTVAQLSLAGISAIVDQDITILHIYLDDTILLLTVSRGDEVLYSRSLSVPGFVQETGDIGGFLHENTNMTYVFVAQRQGTKIDLMLLSGRAKDEDAFITTLLEITGVAVATPVPPKRIRKLDYDTFHEFLPAFGSLFLDEKYDFSPHSVKEIRKFMDRSALVIPILLVLLMIGTVGLVFKGIGLVKGVSELSEKRENVGFEIRRLLSQPLIAKGELRYYSEYLSELYRARRENPVTILAVAGDLVKEFRAKKSVLAYKNGKVTLALELERRFPNLVELNLFVELVKEKLELLKEKGLEVRLGDVRKNLDENSVKISLLVEKKV